MKKVLFLLLITSLTLGVFTACADSNAPTPTPAPATPPVVAEPTPSPAVPAQPTPAPAQEDDTDEPWAELEDLVISDEAKAIGVQALEVTDEFLLGNISIDEVIEILEELDEIGWENGEVGDFPVHNAIFVLVLGMELSTFMSEPTDEDIESIIRNRNSLAELLDIPRQ